MRPFVLSSEPDPAASPPGADAGLGAPAERNATPPLAVAREDLGGTRFADEYEIESRAGAGLTASVYRARRLRDGETVAIRVLNERWRDDPDVLRRWTREAEATLKLVHPNIARVFAHGTHQGRPFVCGEWVDGLPLTRAVQRSPLTLRRALVPICDVLSALSAAQREGVIHGSLKPNNVLVQERQDGTLVTKLLDFGMGRLLKPVPALGRTKAGTVCLVPEYTAPEQIACLETDGRTDVYAVGILLYELLTGEPPFTAGSFETLLRRQQDEALTEVVSRQHRGRMIPREVEAMCLRALAKEPEGRYRSPLEMARSARGVLDLYGARADLPLQPEPSLDGLHTVSKDRLTMPGEHLRSRQKLGLGAALLLLVCGVIWISAPQRVSESTHGVTAIAAGQRALEQGRQRLTHGEVEAAVSALRAAESKLGETAAVQRWLGEALLRTGQREQGVALLRRYLASQPQPPDRARVEALLAQPP
ncbi:MAG TPA: protein kinase, partial [Polyangiales bacterium]